MDVCSEDDVHVARTRLNHLSYCFTPKHHGAGSASDSCWLLELPRPEEFQVFDMADFHQLTDNRGNLYGLRIKEAGGKRQLLELGTKHERIARFWAEEREYAHWHGHPLWPIDEDQPSNRARQSHRPPKEVFDRLIEEALLSRPKARRLRNGSHVGNLD